MPHADALVVFGITGDSAVETFAAARLTIDTPRWQGVPFFLRAGKTLPVTAVEVLIGQDIEVVAQYHPPDQMLPYQRILGDALRGETMVFAREKGVEEMWRIIDPILDDATPVHGYEPGTWGPAAADRLTAVSGGWHNPDGVRHLEEGMR